MKVNTSNFLRWPTKFMKIVCSARVVNKSKVEGNRVPVNICKRSTNQVGNDIALYSQAKKEEWLIHEYVRKHVHVSGLKSHVKHAVKVCNI